MIVYCLFRCFLWTRKKQRNKQKIKHTNKHTKTFTCTQPNNVLTYENICENSISQQFCMAYFVTKYAIHNCWLIEFCSTHVTSNKQTNKQTKRYNIFYKNTANRCQQWWSNPPHKYDLACTNIIVSRILHCRIRYLPKTETTRYLTHYHQL